MADNNLIMQNSMESLQLVSQGKDAMAAHKLVGLIICCKDWYETPRKWQCQPPTPSISSLTVTRNSNNILNSKGMARARGQH